MRDRPASSWPQGLRQATVCDPEYQQGREEEREKSMSQQRGGKFRRSVHRGEVTRSASRMTEAKTEALSSSLGLSW